jgi:hypothetical protein
MRTSLKMILAATAIATLASPVMAQPERGSVARPHAQRVAPVINPLHTDDAVHVAFPVDGSASGGN